MRTWNSLSLSLLSRRGCAQNLVSSQNFLVSLFLLQVNVAAILHLNIPHLRVVYSFHNQRVSAQDFTPRDVLPQLKNFWASCSNSALNLIHVLPFTLREKLYFIQVNGAFHAYHYNFLDKGREKGRKWRDVMWIQLKTITLHANVSVQVTLNRLFNCPHLLFFNWVLQLFNTIVSTEKLSAYIYLKICQHINFSCCFL